MEPWITSDIRAYSLDSAALSTVGLGDAKHFDAFMVFVFLAEASNDIFSEFRERAHVLSFEPSFTSTNWTLWAVHSPCEKKARVSSMARGKRSSSL